MRRVTEKNLGEKLAQFRKENNITQEELAEYLFVTRQAVSNWERGITKPDFTTLEKICGRLGVGIDEFVSSRTNKPQGQRDTDKKERKEFIVLWGSPISWHWNIYDYWLNIQYPYGLGSFFFFRRSSISCYWAYSSWGNYTSSKRQ